MKKKTKQIIAGIITASYFVYAGIWLYVLHIGAVPDGTSYVSQSGSLRSAGVILMISEGIIHLSFILDSWFVWIKEKRIGEFAREMLMWILLAAVWGVLSSGIGMLFRTGNYLNFFEPAFMMAFMAVFNMVIVWILSVMDKTAQRRKKRLR